MFKFVNMWKQAAILGGLIIAIVAAAKYRLATSFDVVVKKLKFVSSIQKPQLLLTLGINNPTPYFANVQKINGKIYANDSLVATIDENFNVKIEKEKITEITINLDILPVGSIVSLLTYLNTKGFKIEIIGFIIIDNLPIPIKYTYDN